jgi:outer membrane immunogenic protein
LFGVSAPGGEGDPVCRAGHAGLLDWLFQHALGRGWSIKGEYLHLGFLYSESTPALGIPGSIIGGRMTAHADVKTSLDIARIGVNYRF